MWLALDEFLEREVALKEILPQPTQTPQGSESTAALHRFLREARVTAKLDHPNIVPIHELARRPNGTLFCVQKLIRGDTLESRLAACDSLNGRLALLPHVIDACQAVAYAHSRGVIHRDLKPSNIMVGPFGETVVVDWGLAKQRGQPDDFFGEPEATSMGLTAVGRALGTPGYMSPEQVRGAVAEIDERSDVFSLGVVLYQLLTGKLPFEAADSSDLMSPVLDGRFRPVREVCPDAPAELAAVAERALQHDPAARYSGAEPLAKELVAYRAGGRVAAYEYRSWDLVKKFVARNRALSALGVAALLILIVASFGIAWQLHNARLSLARSFLERARAAAKSSDWARAAGYYAASRVQSDSREGRWGVATSYEKMPKRVLFRSGAAGSYAWVGFLPGGRGLVLALEPGVVVGRDLDTGAELWRYAGAREPPLDYGIAGGNQLQLRFREGLRYLDATTGQLLGEFAPPKTPCGLTPIPVSASIVLTPEGLADLVVDAADGPYTLMSGLEYYYALCAVSPDGKRVAHNDRSGNVHVWDLAVRTEIASRRTPDASDLIFTPYGLAVVREQSVQVLGENGDDFLVSTPGHHGNLSRVRSPNALSPDGRFLLLGHIESSQADLIDLLSRKVVSTVSYAPGRPYFAFSGNSERLLAAGLAGGSMLVGWDIRQGPAPRPAPGSPLMGANVSRDGRRFVLYMLEKNSRVEVYDASGQLVRRLELGKVDAGNGLLSPDGSRLIVGLPESITVLDVNSGETLLRMDCKLCLRAQLSRDGKRLLTHNSREITLWDVERKAVIWRDSTHAGNFQEPAILSTDGRRVAWSHVKTVFIHTQGGEDQQLNLDGKVIEIGFNEPADRLAVVSSLSIDVYELDGLRAIFRTPNPTWVEGQDLHWSSDDSALVVQRDSQGSALIDSRTGEAFAAVENTSASKRGRREILPDLRHTLSLGNASWSIEPLPVPDQRPPADSLAQVLRESGLALRGVELVYASSAR